MGAFAAGAVVSSAWPRRLRSPRILLVLTAMGCSLIPWQQTVGALFVGLGFASWRAPGSSGSTLIGSLSALALALVGSHWNRPEISAYAAALLAVLSLFRGAPTERSPEQASALDKTFSFLHYGALWSLLLWIPLYVMRAVGVPEWQSYASDCLFVLVVGGAKTLFSAVLGKQRRRYPLLAGLVLLSTGVLIMSGATSRPGVLAGIVLTACGMASSNAVSRMPQLQFSGVLGALAISLAMAAADVSFGLWIVPMLVLVANALATLVQFASLLHGRVMEGT